jgi:hypothetical protein
VTIAPIPHGAAHWRGASGTPPGTRAERLWCGISPAAASTIPLPPSLRWAGFLRGPDGTTGLAMVARVDSLDGELIGVQRTWIDRDAASVWRRRDRASLGPVGGGAVRLAPAGETLLIGEGIETGLAAMQATALPAWAALSTSGMKALRLAPIVRKVVILADNDANGAGARAACAAAARWQHESREVSVWMSPNVGEDANDLLLAAAQGVGVRDAA